MMLLQYRQKEHSKPRNTIIVNIHKQNVPVIV